MFSQVILIIFAIRGYFNNKYYVGIKKKSCKLYIMASIINCWWCLCLYVYWAENYSICSFIAWVFTFLFYNWKKRRKINKKSTENILEINQINFLVRSRNILYLVNCVVNLIIIIKRYEIYFPQLIWIGIRTVSHKYFILSICTCFRYCAVLLNLIIAETYRYRLSTLCAGKLFSNIFTLCSIEQNFNTYLG